MVCSFGHDTSLLNLRNKIAKYLFALVCLLLPFARFNMAPSWECDVCTDQFKDYTSVSIERSHVCVACVRKMFDKAIAFEHEYPQR